MKMLPRIATLFILCFLIHSHSFGNNSTEIVSQQISAKLNLGNHFKWDWRPKMGASFAFEQPFSRKFSLEGELGISTYRIKPFINDENWDGVRNIALDIAVIPKFSWPIELGDTSVLCPYLGIRFGVASISFVKNRAFYGYIGGIALGLKYLYSRHWGIFFEYGGQMGINPSMPNVIMLTHNASSGIIYAL